jgi:hypothetical protein
LSYAGSAAGVWVSLAANMGLSGDAQGDTYSGIERIIGSSYNDTLINDTTYGAHFEGGGGNDGIRGGNGSDYLQKK